MEKGLALLTGLIIVTLLILTAVGGYIVSQRKVQDTDITLRSVYVQNNSLQLTLVNTGKRAWNDTEFEQTYTPPYSLEPVTWETIAREKPGMVTGNTTCFNQNVTINTGETYTCETGMMMPRPGQTLKLRIRLEGTSKTWTHNCAPRTSRAVSC